MTSKALVVFSGGQDSTICLYWAKAHFSEVLALSFDYGQKHAIELESAKKIAEMAQVPHEILKMDLLKEIGNSSLLGDAEITHHTGKENLPPTFVPGRNLLFLTAAAAVAYREGADHLVTGVCQTDYSGYPDCRRDTMASLQVTLNLGMESKIVLHAPLMDLSKAESVKLAQEVGAMEALSYSHTCYNGLTPPCKICDSCLLREKGFSESGIPDPLLERLKNES